MFRQVSRPALLFANLVPPFEFLHIRAITTTAGLFHSVLLTKTIT